MGDNENVPKSIVTLAAAVIILAVLFFQLRAIIGVVLGIYIVARYPKRRGYGFTVFIINLLVFVFGFWQSGLKLF
jgi:Mn2+/Fe2+ NRAMP family transporter